MVYRRNVMDFENDIQAAIDDLPSAGGEVYIPAGTYALSSAISFANKDDITIRGAGYNTVISVSTNISVFDIGSAGNGCDRIKFKDIKFVGSDNADHTENYGLNFIESNYCEVSDCWFEDFGRYGIFWQTCRFNVTKGCMFKDSKDQGLFYDNGASNNVASENVFRDCNGGIATDIGSDYNTFTNNTYDGTNAYTTKHGIRHAFGEGASSGYNVYSGNVVWYAKGTAFKAQSSHCIISNNIVYYISGGSGEHGIFVQGDGSVVSDNTILMGGGQHGIMVQADGVRVSNNTIIGDDALGTPTGSGILVYHNETANINNNRIEGFTANSQHGINVIGENGSESDHNIITGNYVTGSTGTGSKGINLVYCDNSIITSNICTGNTTDTITETTCDGNTLANNIDT